jgi:hypothetical protein
MLNYLQINLGPCGQSNKSLAVKTRIKIVDVLHCSELRVMKDAYCKKAMLPSMLLGIV